MRATETTERKLQKKKKKTEDGGGGRIMPRAAKDMRILIRLALKSLYASLLQC